MCALQAIAAAAPADARISWRARGEISGGVHRGSELGAAASTKAVWWGMRLASPLTHLCFTYLTLILHLMLQYFGKNLLHQ